MRFGKPGTPRNVTQAELTKSEFRHAVLLLLAGHVKLGGKAFSKTVGGRPVKTRQDHSRSIRLPSFSELQTNVKEIDAVFEHYDTDHDGTLNMEEAKTMIKGLHNAGRDADQIRRRKEHATKVQRIRAERKAAVAMSDALDDKKVTVVGQRSMRPSVTNQVRCPSRWTSWRLDHEDQKVIKKDDKTRMHTGSELRLKKILAVLEHTLRLSFPYPH